MAAKYGSLGAANSLISNGADPNVQGKNGLTPLHVAAHYNQVDMVSFLLTKKSSPHAVAKNGYTPLHIAAKYDELEVASLLLQYKAKPNAESKNGFTALHLASQEGHMDMVALLLENKAKVNHQSKNGLTAMHLAAQEDHVPVAETLVQFAADVDAQTKAGYTPLHTACHFGQLNMIEFLLKRGANVKGATKAGYTPLHQAAQQGHVLVTQMLLKHKADPNDLTANGESALWIADQLGFISVTEVLRPLTTVETPNHLDDRYRPQAPEMMQEMAMSDEEDDDKAEENHLAEQSYTYLTTGDDMHGLTDEANSKAMSFQINERESFSPPTQEDMKWMLGQNDSHNKMTMNNAAATGALVQHGKEIIKPPRKKNSNQENDPVVSSKHPRTTEDQHFIEDSKTRTDEWAEQSSIGKVKAGKKKKQPVAQQINNSNYEETHFDDGINDQMNQEQVVNGRYTNGFNGQLESAPNYYSEQTPSILAKGTKPVKETAANIQQTNVTTAPPLSPDYMHTEQSFQVESKPVRSHSSNNNKLQSTPATPGLGIPVFKSNISETDSQMFGSTYSGMSFASSYDPDNVAVVRQPLFSGFLVSFLVDARGGAMRGCRHSGIRIIVPPGRASQPTRVTCKLVRPEKVAQMPTLLEGEALASRVLVIGPAGAKFLGPVILEVPHFASLHGNEREIIVLRSENGHVWKEHCDLATIDTMQKALCGSFDDLESAEDLYHRRITRIITSEFPKYFALVTRIRREMVTLGPSGGTINSTLVPEVQAIFPQGALTKPIKLSLQSQPIPELLVRKVAGDRVTVSPIATIEPRRRKFHKPIQVTLPLPPSVVASNPQLDKSPSLRLLCSMSDPSEITEWEDITGSTPMTLTKNCVSFPIAVSARYWIINTPRYKEAVQIANPLFEEIMLVPFVANFVIFAKRRDALDGQLRIFCMTDDKMVKTLEVQEKFVEVARSRDIEVLDGKPQWVEIHGNLIPVLKSDRQPFVNFRAFRENRLAMNVRIRDMSQDVGANVMFMPESHDDLIQLHQRLGQATPPIANLDIMFPSIEDQRRVDTASMRDASELQERLNQLKQLSSPNEEIISKAELRLTDIAECLDYDWLPLARQLQISEHDIARTQADYGYIPEQALVMLHLWADKGTDVSGNTLARALKAIDRPDIIERCIKSVEIVTDDKEKELSRSLCRAEKFVPSIRIIGGSFESNEAQRLSRDMSTETNDAMINRMATSVVSKAEFESFDNQAEEPAESMIFEDWVQRQSMNSQKPKSDTEFPIVPHSGERLSSPLSRLDDVGEGPPLLVKVEIDEDAWEREDGGSVQRQTVTKKYFHHRETPSPNPEFASNLDHIEIEEEWLELPPGVTEPEEGKYVTRCFSDVHEIEDAFTGVPVKRTIIRTVVISIDGLDDVAGTIVKDSIQSAFNIVSNDKAAHDETDVVAVRVYTDTVEKDPVVETDVKETEEILEDGTIVRRRIIQTKQKKTIIKRVVMEGPEDELPSSKEQAQEMLKQAEYNEPTWPSGINEPTTTDIQEFEEVQPDGTTIKRRIVTTTEQQLTSERIMLEDGLDSSFVTESDGRPPMDETPSESDDDESKIVVRKVTKKKKVPTATLR